MFIIKEVIVPLKIVALCMAHMQLSKLNLLILSIHVFQKPLETHDCVLPWKRRSGTYQKGAKIGAIKEVDMYVTLG